MHHFPNSYSMHSTLRIGDYKLIRNYKPEMPPFELYQLYDNGNRVDIEESKNLAKAMPEKVQELAALWDAVIAHRAHAEQSGVLADRRSFRSREELREIVTNRLRERAREICTGDRWDQLTDEVVAQATDPWTAADEMLDGVDA